MEHQNWDPITFNNVSQTKKKEDAKKAHNNAISKKTNDDPEITRLEAPKQLGVLISQARTTKGKTQKIFATELGISQLILSRWESNKEIPTNKQIADIEKKLGIKLPRCKKVFAKDIA